MLVAFAVLYFVAKPLCSEGWARALANHFAQGIRVNIR